MIQNSKGTINNNIFTESSDTGITVQNDSSAHVFNNNFSGCKRGIFVFESSGIFEKNKIKGIDKMPTEGTGFHITSNTKSGKSCGGEYIGNQITNFKNGIVLEGKGTNPTVKGNNIENCTSGFLLRSETKGIIESNTIVKNVGSALICESGGDPIVRNNHFTANSYVINVRAQALGKYEDNNIADCQLGIKIAKDCGNAHFKGNKFNNIKKNWDKPLMGCNATIIK